MDQTTWWSRISGFLQGDTTPRGGAAGGGPHNDSTQRPLRLVVDTNIFIAAVRAPQSSSRRLLEAIAAAEAVLLVSRPVFREYRRILSKAVGSGERERRIREWIGRAEVVAAGRGPRVVPDDPDDDKFVALALAGGADAIVSNDGHLLDAADRIDVEVLRPGEALRRLPKSLDT